MDQGAIQDLPEEWICDKNYKKVLICHRAPDKPNHFETLCVNYSAVAEHLAHGDYLGPCAVTACPNNVIDWSSSAITVQKLPSAVTIYPNPNQNRLVTISFDAPVEKEGYVYIQDIYGKTIQGMAIEIGQVNLSVEFDAAPPGVYFISIFMSRRVTHKQKLVVVN